MKFDVVVGNPPYSQNKVNIYQEFAKLALKLSDTVCLITPEALRNVNALKGKIVEIIDYPDAFPRIGISASVFMLKNSHNSSEVIINGQIEHIETNSERQARLRERQARLIKEWNSTETKGSVMVSMSKLKEMCPTAPDNFLQQREGSKFRYFMDNDKNINDNQLMLQGSAINSGRNLYIDTWSNVKKHVEETTDERAKDKYYFPIDMNKFNERERERVCLWLRDYHPICQRELLRHINNSWPIPNLKDDEFGTDEWQKRILGDLGFSSLEEAREGISI
jgi:hypothetical protein